MSGTGCGAWAHTPLRCCVVPWPLPTLAWPAVYLPLAAMWVCPWWICWLSGPLPRDKPVQGFPVQLYILVFTFGSVSHFSQLVAYLLTHFMNRSSEFWVSILSVHTTVKLMGFLLELHWPCRSVWGRRDISTALTSDSPTWDTLYCLNLL